MCWRIRHSVLDQRLAERGIGQGRPAVGGTDLKDPVHESQLERAALPHAADAAVRDGIDRDHRGQVGRVHLGQRVLGAAGITRAEGADLAVGPILPGDPLHDLKAILGIVNDQSPGPLTGITAPNVVGNHDIAALRIIDAIRLDPVLVVGGAGQERREPAGSGLAIAGRAIDVCGQPDSVLHRDHHVLLDHDAELRRSLRRLRPLAEDILTGEAAEEQDLSDDGHCHAGCAARNHPVRLLDRVFVRGFVAIVTAITGTIVVVGKRFAMTHRRIDGFTR